MEPPCATLCFWVIPSSTTPPMLAARRTSCLSCASDCPGVGTRHYVPSTAARFAGVAQQLARIPEDATHLVISAGGNDALGYAPILAAPSRSMAESLTQLADIGEAFQAHYRAAIENVLQRRLPTAVAPSMRRASAAHKFGVLGGHVQIRRNRSREVL